MVLVLAALLPVLIFTFVMFRQKAQLQHEAVERGMRDTARALSLALDREIGKPGENRGQIVANWEFQPAAAFHYR